MKIILVDGYNVIHASSFLKVFFSRNIHTAQAHLVEAVCRYCCLEDVKGYIVFDAYRKEGGEMWEEVSSLVKVIYTAKGKTADSFIEQFIARNKSKYNLIYIVTSDLAQGITVLDRNIIPLSPKNFLAEIDACLKFINKKYSPDTAPFVHYLISGDTLRRIREQKNIKK